MAELLRESLADKDSRIRAAAVTALRRLGKADAAPSILPLVADPDPIISHLAIRALGELRASKVCLDALDAAIGTGRAGRGGGGDTRGLVDGRAVPPAGPGVSPGPSNENRTLSPPAPFNPFMPCLNPTLLMA